MLPKPNDNESDADFITRALKDEEMLAKYPHQEERIVALQEILNEVRNKEKESEIAAGIERRTMLADDLEMRVEGGDEAKKLVGYAAKFNKWSEKLYWFREKIAPGAFADALKISDVRGLFNHDPNLILGRSSSGTLRLEENDTGLKFDIDIPDTNTGRDTVQYVSRGDVTGCSFSFTVKEDSWKYAEDKNDIDERTIIKVERLFDVGPVTFPAYPDTSVAARDVDTAVAKRSRDAFKEAHKQEEKKKEEPQTETVSLERQRAIDRGYRKAGRIINRCRSADV